MGCSPARSGRTGPPVTPMTLSRAAQIAAAWSLVHGFAMLMLDGRLKPLVARMPKGTDEMTLLTAVLSGATGGM